MDKNVCVMVVVDDDRVSEEGRRGEWASVSCGGEHTVGVTRGMYYDEAAVVSSSMRSVLKMPSAYRVACGAYHTVVLSGGGRAWAWGEGVFQRGRDGCIPALGQRDCDTESTTPVPIEIVARKRPYAALAAAAGGYHTVLLCRPLRTSNDTDGVQDRNEVMTCGAAQLGQLGRRLPASPLTDSTGLPVSGYPRPVDGMPDDCDPTVIGAGFYNTYVGCRHQRGLFCAGENMFGQCGEGIFNEGTMRAIKELMHLQVRQVDGGYCHSLVRTGDGRVYSMGCGEDGQRGDGRFDEDRTHGEVSEVKLPCQKCVSIAAGLNHSLALCDDGRVFAWGSNEMGQLGVPGDSNQSTPVNVKGIPKAKAISAGSTHSAVLDSLGRLWTFGSNDSEQLMTARQGQDYSSAPRSVPVPPAQ